MIIRRRHNSNFTIIQNDCFEDERLGVEEVAFLTYLRSKPDDWQVNIKQLCSRFKMGRDRGRRTINALIEAGYIKRVKVRDPETRQWSGTEYVVYDRPEVATDCEPAPEIQAVGEPAPEKPTPGKPTPGNQGLYIRTDSNQGLTPTNPPKPPQGGAGTGGKLALPVWGVEDFDAFLNAYPKQGRPQDIHGAYVAYLAVSQQGKPDELLAAAKNYATWCDQNQKTGTRFVKSPKRFLEENLWNVWKSPIPPPPPEQVLVRCGTPAWDAWQSYMKATTGRGTPRSERDDGWWFPSDQPPPLQRPSPSQPILGKEHHP